MIKIEEVKLIEKEIKVKSYLTYAQIQSIVNAVCKFDTWAEREQNIDILLLHYATDLTDEEIEKYGHIILLQSGVIDEVKESVKNFDKIYEAIAYTESISRSLASISKQLPDIVEKVKKNVIKSSKK